MDKQQQWVLKLGGYNCKIEYLAGKDNTCADLLSRILKQLETRSIKLEPGVDDKAFKINVINSHRLEGRPSWEDQEVGEIETITDPHWTDIVRQSQGDSDITTFRSRVEAGNTSKYVLQGGVLYYLSGKDEEVSLKMVIPEKLRSEILDQCHRKLGHMGIEKTCGLIMRTYYWPKLFNDDVDHVSSSCMHVHWDNDGGE